MAIITKFVNRFCNELTSRQYESLEMVIGGATREDHLKIEK